MIYYQDEWVTLHYGDCLDITHWLATDVLVTDPPYGRGWKQFEIDRRPNGHRGIYGDETTAARDAALALWGPRPAVVFGDLMLTPPPGTKQVLIYRKPSNAGTRGAMGGYRRDAEAVYLIGSWMTGLGGRTSIITTNAASQGNPSSVQGRFNHPHAKPQDVMQTLIQGCPPGVVADPFAGSGSTLVAAKAQGRKAVGVEIDERYCEIAARRLAQDTLFVGQP